MKKIPIAKVEPGHVLAEPVRHGAGQVLLAAGTALDDGHIDMMRQRGVLLVTVETTGGAGEGGAEPGEIDPEILKQVLIEESQWYGDARKHPLMAEVFRFVVARRARARAAEQQQDEVGTES